MIVYDEVLKAIQDIESQDAEGFTTFELQRATGWERSRVRRYLRELIDAGKAEMSGKKWTVTIDQKRTPVAAYRLL